MWQTGHVNKLNLIPAFLILCVVFLKLIQELKEKSQLGSFLREGALGSAGFTKVTLRSTLQMLKMLMLNV